MIDRDRHDAGRFIIFGKAQLGMPKLVKRFYPDVSKQFPLLPHRSR